MITMAGSATHHKKLERMYLSAPIHKDLYKGISIHVANEQAEIALLVEPKFFHAAHAIHGSVYFKMLDDAAFFAVNSRWLYAAFASSRFAPTDPAASNS